jgi:hypothetical protein
METLQLWKQEQQQQQQASNLYSIYQEKTNSITTEISSESRNKIKSSTSSSHSSSSSDSIANQRLQTFIQRLFSYQQLNHHSSNNTSSAQNTTIIRLRNHRQRQWKYRLGILLTELFPSDRTSLQTVISTTATTSTTTESAINHPLLPAEKNIIIEESWELLTNLALWMIEEEMLSYVEYLIYALQESPIVSCYPNDRDKFEKTIHRCLMKKYGFSFV